MTRRFFQLLCVPVLVLTASASGFADRVGLGKGFRPPSFSATDLDGTRHTLEEYQNRILVLHFWATWCPYCRKEIPELRELQHQWAAKDVRVLTVSTDEDLGKLKQFVAQQRLPYPVIADAQQDESVSDQYGVSGIPVTYVIGRDGRIAERLNGASEIIDTVRRVLEHAS